MCDLSGPINERINPDAFFGALRIIVNVVVLVMPNFEEFRLSPWYLWSLGDE